MKRAIDRLMSFGHAYGLFALSTCLLCRIYYRILAAVFGFHPWHASAPYYCRPYKAEVLKLISQVGSDTIVEIGCGLGDIIGRASAERRFGFDIDINVVRAARFLHKDVVFEKASLSSTTAVSEMVGRPIDVLVMVNWPHELAFDQIYDDVRQLQAAIGIKFVLLDSIRPERPGFLYHHSPEQIGRLGRIRNFLQACDNVRDLYLVELDA